MKKLFTKDDMVKYIELMKQFCINNQCRDMTRIFFLDDDIHFFYRPTMKPGERFSMVYKRKTYPEDSTPYNLSIKDQLYKLYEEGLFDPIMIEKYIIENS